MRLSTILLLVTLSFCCCEADSFVCPALAEEMRSYLTTPADEFLRLLSKFGASKEAVAAKLTVKRCTDQLSQETKDRIQNIMVKMLEDCNKIDATEIIL